MQLNSSDFLVNLFAMAYLPIFWQWDHFYNLYNYIMSKITVCDGKIPQLQSFNCTDSVDEILQRYT